MKVSLEVIKFKKPEDVNVIVGQSHFVKTVEDIYEVLVESSPSIKFGLAFCEASGKCLVRVSGNNEELKQIASSNALDIGCGHMFIIVMSQAYPINVLNQVKNVSEVCHIFCATANPLEIIVGQTGQGRAVLGVVDGFSPKGVEKEADVKERKELLRKFGYKL
tara:strand:+ start:1989 stop:2477 length:489 start_codon:yes stop_codon:yes gene_type:complete